MAHLPSVAGVKVWKVRTGFRLLKCLASMGMWLCTHKAKGAFPCMHSDRAQWTFHWFGGLVNSNIPFLEVIDTGIHTDNGQQVAIDYNINFISNRHDLQCFELLGPGDRTLTLKASRSQHFALP